MKVIPVILWMMIIASTTSLVSGLQQVTIGTNYILENPSIHRATKMSGNIEFSTLEQFSNLSNLTTTPQNTNITDDETLDGVPAGNANEITGSISSSHHPACFKSDKGYWCTWNP